MRRVRTAYENPQIDPRSRRPDCEERLRLDLLTGPIRTLTIATVSKMSAASGSCNSRLPTHERPRQSHIRQRHAHAGRSAAIHPVRGKPHTSKPSPRGAPAPCRCCSSPCRRRMCCSRAFAAKGSGRAGRPCASLAHLHESGPAAGACRRPRRSPCKAACGPPKPSGTPKRWSRADPRYRPQILPAGGAG